MNTREPYVMLAVLVLVSLTACGAETKMIEVSVAQAATAAELTEVSVAQAATAAEPTAAPEQARLEVAAAITTLEDQVIAVYETVGPSVVNITNRNYAYDRFMRAVPLEGSGSGFVYDAEGHIVTNYHVIEDADELVVTLSTGEEYEAEVVGTDPANDLAVIHIDAGASLPAPVALADSGALRVGQFVVAIGNPYGLDQTLTTGVVSALGRVIESPEDDRFIGEAIQTDAAINPGNSGGPLLDLRGRVIGVNSQIISPSGASSGIGFAVSSDTVHRVVPQLIAQGYYSHPWLGTQMLPLTATTAQAFREAGMDVTVESGLLVLETVDGGPADEAGLEGGDRVARVGNYRIPLGGDVITAIDGEPVGSFQDLTVYLETETTIGDTVTLTVIRDGYEQSVQVTLEERPQE